MSIEYKVIEPSYEKGRSIEEFEAELKELGDQGWDLKTAVEVREIAESGDYVFVEKETIPVLVFTRIE